jgi:hypothetical protein
VSRSEPLTSRCRRPTRAGVAFLACLFLAACGGGDDGASGGGPLPAGEDGASSPAAEGSRENPSSPQPGSGGGQVAAEDVAQVKLALEQIRTCRPGRTDLGGAAATIAAVLRDVGSDGLYESNDTVEPMNMRSVALRARAGLVRCQASSEVQALNAVLRQS